VTNWTSDELTRLDDADEMHVAGTRRDGSLRPPVIVWMVRLGDDLYTRSVNGPEAAWFRGTRANHKGHISANGVDKDVTFVDIDAGDKVNADLDAAYRAKYRRYSGPVASITSELARSTTLKVIPRQQLQEGTAK
jgi:hypothetical protein